MGEGGLGAMPVCHELEAFARAQGFPLPCRLKGGHLRALAAVQQQFAAKGRWAPATPPPKGQPRAYDFAAVDVQQPGETRRRKRRTKQECIAGIVAYLDQLPAGQQLSQKRYGAWRRGIVHPASSAFAQHGGWTGLVAAARGSACRPAIGEHVFVTNGGSARESAK
jgi:hypothetical protein